MAMWAWLREGVSLVLSACCCFAGATQFGEESASRRRSAGNRRRVMEPEAAAEAAGAAEATQKAQNVAEAVEAEADDRSGARTPQMLPESPLLGQLADLEVPEAVLSQIRPLPEVQQYILDLHTTIRSFRNATAALQQLSCGGSNATSQTVFMPKKKKKVEPVKSVGGEADSWTAGMSIADQVKQIAEDVVQETGFVYHESLGLYYDNNTGYYYDPSTGLYYDGVNKTYYTYDEGSGVFSLYHQQEEKDPEEEKREHWEQELERKKRELLLEVKKMKTKKRKEEKRDDEEEGECSPDTEDDSFNYYKRKKPSAERAPTNQIKIPTADEIDPCMRMIVQETDIAKLKVGTLFIVTCTGGTLGREGEQHSVTIPDLNVSKSHCTFSYEECGYWVTDSGSTNGTWLNKKKLKNDKTKQILHGSVLRVANTTLLCHVHSGQETCGHCEPGLVQRAEAATPASTEPTPSHKEELLRLRRRFALSGVGEAAEVGALGAGYTDRADKRRATVGSQHHGEKTEAASTEAALPASNKGFKMLEKMGWKTGDALGSNAQEGIIEPINVEMRGNKVGLGLESIPMPSMPAPKERRRQAAWDKARSRYQNIPEPPPPEN